MQLIDRVVQFRTEIEQIRRDIHAHPELRFEETRTSDIVAQKLSEWGLEVTRGLGGTGVVGTLRHGKSKRAVGLRADMDALPIQETNEFAHRSTHAGKMHACGHDGHMAMLLAAAKYLAETKSLDGTVHFIFQPAEEGGAGAQRMIDDGLFERFPCDAVFGMHNWPGLKVGEFGVTGGPMMASSNEFRYQGDRQGRARGNAASGNRSRIHCGADRQWPAGNHHARQKADRLGRAVGHHDSGGRYHQRHPRKRTDLRDRAYVQRRRHRRWWKSRCDVSSR